jgi:hypothetical protein
MTRPANRSDDVISQKYSSVFVAALYLGIVTGLAGCGGSSSSGTVISPPPQPPAAPDGVQVVAGDGNNSDLQNTISWMPDSAATGYTVYWSNTPGVTTSSSVLVPSAEGSRYAIHSDVDVVAGTTYYYRVEATGAGGASSLSAEVQGTPQTSVTNSSLNDVAWNGVDTLVTVGDSGVILRSANGLTDGWSDVSSINAPQSLSAVTWENVNSQFVIVGAGSTVLTGDGTNWVREDLSNLQGALNLEDIAWLGDRYIAVGNSGSILTSNADGSAWAEQDAGPGVANTALNAVAANDQVIVVVGTNGTILNSADGVAWTELAKPTNNDLNAVTWDGAQFTVVGSNDTILTSADGANWTSHVPGTSDINFVAVTQWDSGLPATPVVGTVGSAGTYVVAPSADPGTIIRTGTTEQLGGMTWVDEGINPPYFMIVGNDGTVLTTHYR